MTHLIIHNDITTRREYLLEQINKHLERDFTSIAQLHNIPDMHIIELTSSSSIGIDQVKALQKEMIFQPFEEIYQVGLIFHADSLTTQAQNALLKTLEEGGERTLYYLLVSNERNLLPTIISRSIKHYVKTQAKPELDIEVIRPEVLDMGAIQKFTTVEGIINEEKETGVAVKEFMNELLRYYREQLITNTDDPTKANEVTEYLSYIIDTDRKISANVNKRMALERLMLKIG